MHCITSVGQCCLGPRMPGCGMQWGAATRRSPNLPRPRNATNVPNPPKTVKASPCTKWANSTTPWAPNSNSKPSTPSNATSSERRNNKSMTKKRANAWPTLAGTTTRLATGRGQWSIRGDWSIYRVSRRRRPSGCFMSLMLLHDHWLHIV